MQRWRWAYCLFFYNHSFEEIQIAKTYKRLEAIAVECMIGRKEILCLALYRPPKQSKGTNGSKYFRNVEEEMNDLFQWSCLQKQGIAILGDLNTDRLSPGRGEGKMLTDSEEIYIPCPV